MKLHKANSKQYLHTISIYKNKNIKEIRSIKIRWAHGSNKEHYFEYLENHSVFMVKTKELINKIDFGEMGFKKLNPHVLFNGTIVSDGRIAKALEHWEKNNFMDPPILALKSSNLYIVNGRHRTIVAFHLGEKTIPVAIPNDQINEIGQILNLNNHKKIEKH